MDNDGAGVENKMRQNGVIERSGGGVNDAKKQSHGKDSGEFERRKVDGRKHEGLKNDGGSAFSETLSCHVGDESAKNVFFKNGGHQCEDEDTNEQFWEGFHVEHRLENRLSFGIEYGKNPGKIAQWQVFEKGGGKGNEGNHAQGHEGGAEEFIDLWFFGKS